MYLFGVIITTQLLKWQATDCQPFHITKEKCSVNVSNLWHKFVIFPEIEDQMLRATFKIESMWQFPGVFGGIDGYHIQVSVNNTCIFQASHLYGDLMRGNALPVIKKVLTVQSQREVKLPPILLGDSAFHDHSCLQKPFTNTV